MTQERTDHLGGAGQVSTSGVSSGGDGLRSATRRRYDTWVVPFGLTACYGLFAVAVHLRLFDDFDVAVRHAVHAGEVWGPTQIRANRVVDALRPTHLALPLLLVVAATSARRRTLRPFAVMMIVGFPVLIVTLGSKWVMAHWDPGTVPVGHGSFPSGHAVSVLTAFGVVVLLLRPGTRWGWMLPALMGCVMGVALVLASVHPATDVLGAGLLVAAVLTWATSARLGEWASRGQRSSTR
jgi:membrane-associated phospholipid phosphatase